MAWRVARSLETLLSQINAAAPNRSKKSDGSIGDTAHSNRDSDHNPWYGPGIVTARDFTHDPAGGLSGDWLATALVQSGDPRIKYVIWDRRIWTPGRGWAPYKGANPHTSHLHLSVVASPAADDAAPWRLTPTNKPEEDTVSKAEVRQAWQDRDPDNVDKNGRTPLDKWNQTVNTGFENQATLARIETRLRAMDDKLSDDEANILAAVRQSGVGVTPEQHAEILRATLPGAVLDALVEMAGKRPA